MLNINFLKIQFYIEYLKEYNSSVQENWILVPININF